MKSKYNLRFTPRISLTIFFLGWKSLLLAIAFLSPWPGYDSSTSLIYTSRNNWALPLVRWDAVYFTQVAHRDYLFEQEWAFSWGLTRLMRVGAQGLAGIGFLQLESPEAWAGVIISHTSHLIAIHVLYSLSQRLFCYKQHAQDIAFAAACLHVISPAGIFLSAPYAESIFAALQFLGYLTYVRAWTDSSRPAADLLLSGMFFGAAMPMRSNGLLSGILFAYDATTLGLQILSGQRSISVLGRFVLTIIAGTCIAAGAALPQFIAYQHYCVSNGQAELRPWCFNLFPSIYIFVQARYWDNGFLRYWTISNIPLFLLAVPAMSLLGVSCSWAWKMSRIAARPTKQSVNSLLQTKEPGQLLLLIAIPQALLALSTLLNSHVQIITRIASGYPLWYLWLAAAIQGDAGLTARRLARPAIQWMVLYAMIQAGLFASFLPPA